MDKRGLQYFAIRNIVTMNHALRLSTLISSLGGGLGSILLFHRVMPSNLRQGLSYSRKLSVTPQYLEKTICYCLENNYRIISIDEVYRTLVDGDGTRKFVCFTFDDGYLDNYLQALPIFQKYNLPFTIYVTTSFPDLTFLPWRDMLAAFILENDSITFDTTTGLFRIRCDSLSEKEIAYQKISGHFSHLDPTTLRDTMTSVFGKEFDRLRDNFFKSILTWDNLRALAAEKVVTLGAHSITHPKLSEMPKVTVVQEMTESKKRLEEEIGIPIEHFAYPFGSRDDADVREFQIAEKIGFKTALTTRQGNISPKSKDNLSSLPRIPGQSRWSSNDVRHFSLWFDGLLPFLIRTFRPNSRWAN